MNKILFPIFILLSLLANFSYAESNTNSILTIAGTGAQANTFNLSLQILAMMTVLTLLPALLMSMTAFTRIAIVLSILRQAIGMPTTPTNQIIIGLSLFLTFFVMSPVIDKVNAEALQPYINNKMSSETALNAAQQPLREFMLSQTREKDLSLFTDLSGKTNVKAEKDLPFSVLMPAFLTSELKTAFQIGFLLFLPFLIIDLVIASVLMSMGMMMLSPMIISLPFKIMLFVLVDGWTLIMGTLASSFAI